MLGSEEVAGPKHLKVINFKDLPPQFDEKSQFTVRAGERVLLGRFSPSQSKPIGVDQSVEFPDHLRGMSRNHLVLTMLGGKFDGAVGNRLLLENISKEGNSIIAVQRADEGNLAQVIHWGKSGQLTDVRNVTIFMPGIPDQTAVRIDAKGFAAGGNEPSEVTFVVRSSPKEFVDYMRLKADPTYKVSR